MCIAVSNSARNDVVGGGGAIEVTANGDGEARRGTFSLTVGWSAEQNPYSGELATLAHALTGMPDVRHRRVALLTTNQAVALTLRTPRQHSGQEHVRSIYNSIKRLWKNGNDILVVWIPSSSQDKTLLLAKREARQATKQGSIPSRQASIMKSTTLNLERKRIETQRSLPDRVGNHTKKVDAALPGAHTRQLYDNRPWTERSSIVNAV
ncbi:hypothetical protein ISF_09633 [Cordyceps fumosorosea ARSEF 2679]|uniref:Uncharacterized protein n=1 Tax=Cordyceps fumosorosea (strain ARSEF 2679) TaxID=1081104 RepID=A0A167EVB9_CORFA|nr:hypothetical protein ISF_09633 [Cordyceps fumosorosea ARSEF 2679]OAA44439.1 hypothetical protein ISF_09633 [Cordyceps fumosorosea ARSEF 2679]